MKTLQNDFTTPEQSKRLLELGVPKVTANYYYDSRDFKPQAHEVRGHWNEEDDRASRHGYKITPLWSVGRLIEIFIICTPYVEIRLRTRIIEQLIASYEDVIKQGLMDFSKLEE